MKRQWAVRGMAHQINPPARFNRRVRSQRFGKSSQGEVGAASTSVEVSLEQAAGYSRITGKREVIPK
jgi:hypothetical protein